jgi:hypothetical protein
LRNACREGKIAAVRRLLNAGLSPNAIAPGDVAMDTAHVPLALPVLISKLA